MQTLPAGPRTGRLLNTMRLMLDPYGSFPRWQQRYGDPFTVKALNGTIVMTGSPEGIQEIFTAPPDTFSAFQPDALRFLLGPASLLVISGDRHRRDRKLLTPPFHGHRMKAWGAAMAEITAEKLGAEPRELAMQDVTGPIALDVIVRTVFGVEEADRRREFADAIGATMDAVSPLFVFAPVLQRSVLGRGPWARYERASARLDALLFEQIRRVRPEAAERTDVLSLMLQCRYDDGSAMPDEDVRDELRTLLVAGHETTAIALAWAVYHVLRNPDVHDRLRTELLALPTDAEPDAYAKLPYLDAVAKETLRLHPLVTEVLRTVEKPFVLRGVEVPPGASVSSNILLAHRREDVWPEPDLFRPERFVGRTYAPYEYLPFGGGTRRCIGAAFASYEMAIVLGTLFRRYDVEAVGSETLVPKRRNVTMGPSGPVRVRISPRR